MGFPSPKNSRWRYGMDLAIDTNTKGARYFENEPMYVSGIDDIDMAAVAEYCDKIGYAKSPEEYIKQNKKFIIHVGQRQEMSGAAILLFGKNPQLFFERARVRFLRYEGIEAKVGAAMNVVKDVFLKAVFWIWLKPQFVWKGLIVNAIAHRDYSIKGTDIQIKMFDDHLTVESSGMLPGIVRLNNMREIRFSRNPKIAGLLHEYEYVREFGEGVDRMYYEMEQAGLPDPEYLTEAFMVYATIKNKKFQEQQISSTPKIPSPR